MARKITDVIRTQFVSGVLVVVPVILTYIVLKFLFETIDGILEPVVFRLFGYHFPGLGVVTTLLLIMLAGILTRNFIGNKIYRIGDRILAALPVIRPVYSAAKQLLEAMASSGTQSFKEVGLVTYPRPNSYALCFISKRSTLYTADGERELVTCFVPSTPTPVSGMVVLVPTEDVLVLDMSVEEGIKFLVSGGVASPENLRTRLKASEPSTEEVSGETR